MTDTISLVFILMTSGVIGGFFAIVINDLIKDLSKRKYVGILKFIIKFLIIFVLAILMVWWIQVWGFQI